MRPSEIYWHEDWANHPDEDKSPLGWPDIVDCYNIEWAQSFIGNTKTNFYAVHAQWHEDHNADAKYLKQYLRDFAQSVIGQKESIFSERSGIR